MAKMFEKPSFFLDGNWELLNSCNNKTKEIARMKQDAIAITVHCFKGLQQLKRFF